MAKQKHAGGNATATADQVRQHQVIALSGAATAGRTLTLNGANHTVIGIAALVAVSLALVASALTPPVMPLRHRNPTRRPP